MGGIVESVLPLRLRIGSGRVLTLADRRDRRANELAGGKVARARAQTFAERGEIHLYGVRWTRVELREALREEARCGVRGFHLQELVERGGDLNESLEKVPLRVIRRDSPTLLPRFVSLEELSRVEEARPECEGIIQGTPAVYSLTLGSRAYAYPLAAAASRCGPDSATGECQEPDVGVSDFDLAESGNLQQPREVERVGMVVSMGPRG